MELKGKTAIVTGVSKGIGLALAHMLLREGMRVIGWSRTAPAGINHPEFTFIPTDIRSATSVHESYRKSLALAGNGIAVLVNNAGLGYASLWEDTSIEDYQSMMQTNVDGLFYATKEVLPDMKSNRLGHIVNVASIASKDGIEKFSVYCGTKWAVRGMSIALFKEVRDFNIKVSCVMPGSVNTEFFDHIDFIQAHDQMLKPEEVAEGIVYLLKTPGNVLPAELELRPLNPKPKV